MPHAATALTLVPPSFKPAAERLRHLVGLVGAGIQSSLTPAMHEAEAQALGLHLHYQLIDLDAAGVQASALPSLVRAAQTMGFSGLNITYPCKQQVVAELDELSEEARAIGAVNTVVFANGRATGHNTDVTGWRWALQRDLPDADLGRVVLLGAGGAGSAIAHALQSLQAEHLVLVDPQASRTHALAAQLNQARGKPWVSTAVSTAQAMTGATGLVHATPTGMDKLPGLPLDAALLHPSLWVSEIVYFPLETALLKAAREAGCQVANGSGMAAGQAVDAFALFTGCQPDRERVCQHLQRLVAQRQHEEA